MTVLLCLLLAPVSLYNMEVYHLAKVVEGEGVLTVPLEHRQEVASAVVHTLLNGLGKWGWPRDISAMARSRFMGYHRVGRPSDEALALASYAYELYGSEDKANGALFVFGHQDIVDLKWESTTPCTVWSWEGEGEKFYGYQYFPSYYKEEHASTTCFAR